MARRTKNWGVDKWDDATKDKKGKVFQKSDIPLELVGGHGTCLGEYEKLPVL